MNLRKKIGIGCVSIFVVIMVIMGIMGMSSKASLTSLKVMEDNMILLVVASLEHVNGGNADNAASAEDYKYTVNQDGTAEITQYLKEDEHVKIPSALDGHPVTAIGKYAFSGKRLTASIVIPGTVTVIREKAFSGSGMKEVIIPESVVKIEDMAFCACWELEWIYISKNVKYMEGNIVRGSDKLAQIDVSPHNAVYTSVDGILYNKDMTEILAVPGGKNLKDFQFPDTVVCIGREAFSQNTSTAFTELVIPEQVTTLKKGAFESCKNLERVIIGQNVTGIADAAFLACSNLSEVVIHGRPKKIGRSAFCDCYFLTKINIPDSVAEIGDMAFYNCGSLESIMVPGSVTQIGNKAIGYSEDCSELTGATIMGGKGTDAYRYAKRAYVAFRDVETGEIIRYDLVFVPRERIEFLFAGKKRIELDYKEIEKATYQVAVREVGTSSWEKHYVEGTSANVRGLKAKKQYEVKVRALREIEGEEYYGKWSKVKKVTMGSGVR